MNVPISQKPKFILLVSVFTAEPAASRLATSFPVCRANPLLSLEPAVPGNSPEYYKEIASSVRIWLEDDNHYLGSFICQGKMPLAVRQKYESLLNTPKDCELPANPTAITEFCRSNDSSDTAQILENAALFATECNRKS